MTDNRQAFLTALTTEHFVLQTAAAATVSEAGTRASLYILSLSSALVAMGFASQSPDVFLPFVATVLPALVLLGLFTVVRLVDAAMEYNECLNGIARIRGYYRTLTPEAEVYFSPQTGRWPETIATPTLRFGPSIAFITTIASLVAFINSIVAGAGVALLAGTRLGPERTFLAVGIGIATAVAIMAIFFAYQRWRYSTQ
jgi:hypothetical protein